MEEDGLLTALPGSTDPDTGLLRVTAFVTPRLDVAGAPEPVELANFPSFADWGAACRQLSLALEFEGGGTGGTLELEPDPRSPVSDPELWRTLFATVRVGSGAFQDLSPNAVPSFPAFAVSQLIRTTYALVAQQSPTAFPPATAGPLAGLHDIGVWMNRRRDVDDTSPPTGGLKPTSPPPNSPGTAGRIVDRDALDPPTSPTGSVQTMTEALRFYDRPGAKDPLGPDVEPPPPPRPELEFHGFVSALADYPELLRHLGLALDFVIPDGGQLPAEGRVRFEVRDGPADWLREVRARPWTAYEIVDRRFTARPREREEELVDGSLRVESERLFLLEQIDLDGGALKVASTARTVVNTTEVVEQHPGTADTPASMTPDAASLPALRGVGLTLYRDRRAGKVVAGWDNAKAQDAALKHGDEVDLFAEDVTRGYRLEVAEEADPDRWLSLHRRVGDYQLRTGAPGERAPLPTAEPLGRDEGYVKAASASTNAAEPAVAYLHEAVAGWEGWSLAAPRPGNRIGQLAVEEPVPPADEPPGFALPLVVAFRPVPGSLPSLRFGRAYRMRVRLVDMAGRSVPREFLEPSHVTPFVPFRRWDPVPAPAVVPRRPFTEGESLLRMVIRSTLGMTTTAYAEWDEITGLAGHTRDDLAYRAVNERHLAAPIGSQQLAELHGRFDAAVRESSSAAERDAAFALATLADGSFLSAADGGLITDGQAPPRPVVVVEGTPTQGPGEYVLHDVDQLALPYLPDPLGVGLSFTTLPGDGDTRVQDWPTGGDWFDRRPLRLRVEAGSGPPTFDPQARLLRVFLPQAEHVAVRLSSVLPPEALPLMGVWMLETAAHQAAQEPDAVRGRHWMLTPYTVLDLVHAVEKPLAPPVIAVADPPTVTSGVHRFPGETFAALHGTIATHARSTGRIDVEATWTEPIDDVREPAPQDHAGAAHVGDFLIGRDEDACRIGRNDHAGTAAPPTHLVRHELGDTKHRWVDYRATATTRFREYFPTSITDQPERIRHVGPALRLNVPSSHRPDPPQVEYVVPTWTWEERASLGARGRLGLGFGDLRPTRVRRRIGGGLRIYLARPWFSSGVDELLGVVVRDQPWLTWALDRDAGLTVSDAVAQLADLAAEQLLAAGLGRSGGPARRRASERLLADAAAVTPASPAVLARGTDLEDAALTGHLAALDGVGETAAAAASRARGALLTGVLDAVAGDQVGPGVGALGEALAGLQGTAGPLVSRWGTDPAWASGRLAAGPYIHQFPLRSAVGNQISLPGQGQLATVVGHAPAYDPGRRLWFCDVQLEAGLAYQPFVDLALVRYQPFSIAGRHASAVVRPGFVQLVPDRTAAVSELPGRSAVAVSVRGPSGYNILGLNFMFGSPDAALVDASRQVLAQVQTRPVGADDLDWVDAAPAVALRAGGDSLADIVWHGIVPRPEVGEGREARLVVREHELFETDVSQVETWVDRPAGGVGEAPRKAAGRRLVFAADFSL